MHTNGLADSHLTASENTIKSANCSADWSVFMAPLREELDNKGGEGRGDASKRLSASRSVPGSDTSQSLREAALDSLVNLEFWPMRGCKGRSCDPLVTCNITALQQHPLQAQLAFSALKNAFLIVLDEDRVKRKVQL